MPFLVFTGTNDEVAPPRYSAQLFDAPGASPVRGLVNKKGATHHEPSRAYNPALATFTAAWFKLCLLPKHRRGGGVDFDELIYGDGFDSLCYGGDGSMAQCDLLR